MCPQRCKAIPPTLPLALYTALGRRLFIVTQPSSSRCSAVSSDLLTCVQRPVNPVPPRPWLRGCRCHHPAWYLAVEEALEFQLSYAQLPIFLSQAPACLGKVELSPPRHAHILWLLSQLHLVGSLQLEVFEAPAAKRRGLGCASPGIRESGASRMKEVLQIYSE